jgi:hypothetical protein
MAMRYKKIFIFYVWNILSEKRHFVILHYKQRLQFSLNVIGNLNYRSEIKKIGKKRMDSKVCLFFCILFVSK